MTQSTINLASAYFNLNWQRYKNTVKKNFLYHTEMFATLNNFLDQHFSNRPFSFVDIGCGDSSSIAPVLKGRKLKKYIGIDEAAEVLKLASSSLVSVSGKHEFLCQNMLDALSQVKSPVDIIFSSYAIHHLTINEKINFIQEIKSKLSKNGFFILIDIVRDHQQLRDEWLSKMQQRFKYIEPDISPDELDYRMSHLRSSDHPEHLSTFRDIASYQGWRDFQVMIDKGMFAFMVFSV